MRVINMGAHEMGAMIPNWLLQVREVSVEAKLAYGALSYFCEPSGQAHVTIEALAEHMGVEVDVAGAALFECEYYELLKMESDGTGETARRSIRFLAHQWIRDAENYFPDGHPDDDEEESAEEVAQ